MDALKSSGKPLEISKREVWEAYEGVKANRGTPGVDSRPIEDFEKDLKGNLYKIWNRMSSGAYFPPPVRAVEIPKSSPGGGVRILGVPTVSDRIAQTVVARHLMERVDPVFHEDSYGYRPGRSALDAVERCRQRCWKRDWVVDLDVQKFFDSVRWDLIVKAVEAHTDARWVILYVKRWLQAPLQLPDGTLQVRDRGTPQGSAVSPVGDGGTAAADGLRTAVGFYSARTDRLRERQAELEAELEAVQADLSEARATRDHLTEALEELRRDIPPESENSTSGPSGSELSSGTDSTSAERDEPSKSQRPGTASRSRDAGRSSSDGTARKRVERGELMRSILQVLVTAGRTMSAADIAEALGKPTKGKPGDAARESVRGACRRMAAKKQDGSRTRSRVSLSV
ncbi:reverse transcriptase domain-containing protein [Streptomyces netropsis]|uniref:reverse transcriptase domain-containing protein n=1 Tax=Streptomyces netropsis TaxID=55404 RepID=UPI0037BA3C9E